MLGAPENPNPVSGRRQKFCSFFSKFASTEHANVRGVPPRHKITPRVPRARRVHHLDARAHRAEIQADLSRARLALGQRPALARSSRPSTSRAANSRSWRTRSGWRRFRPRARSPSTRRRRSRSRRHGLPTLFSSGLSGGRATSTSLRTDSRACRRPTRTCSTTSLYLYHMSRINIPRINILRTIFLRFTHLLPKPLLTEIPGAPNKDLTKPWVVSDETLTTNEFPHFSLFSVFSV